jgi:putative ABC transport system permease protein
MGVIEQPQGSNPPQVYIPLQPTQRLYASSDSLSSAEVVNTIYVQTASAADISSVQSEISGLMPSATITSDSTLAGQISGSLASTAALARDLGAWLAILTLSAAFTVAALLTLGAVGRRAREFGTLKALGWMSRRIVAQVMGESLVVGIMGGASGILLGLAGAALISARARSNPCPCHPRQCGGSSCPRVVALDRGRLAICRDRRR